MATMTCPKCRGEMHAYERNGVTVEQCGDCRGIFLDRGELERLTAAETAYYGAGDPQRPAAPAPPPPPPASQPAYQPPHQQAYPPPYPARRYDDDDDDYRGGYGSGRRKKRESFLSDLFD